MCSGRQSKPGLFSGIILEMKLIIFHRPLQLVALAAAFLVFVLSASAQSGRVAGTPTPTPPEETERVLTEEVKLNVLAFDENGKFVPDVKENDIVITDNNILNQPTSVRRLPANVLIVMAGASAFLPFLPLLAKQVLLNNFMSDFPAIAIAGDNVDREAVETPHRWDVKFIRNFMFSMYPDHWIVLASPIANAGTTNYSVNTSFKAFTWGNVRNVPQTGTLIYERFLTKFYGFVAARL